MNGWKNELRGIAIAVFAFVMAFALPAGVVIWHNATRRLPAMARNIEAVVWSGAEPTPTPRTNACAGASRGVPCVRLTPIPIFVLASR
ncbi:MAG: hypothetical protein V1723_02710 [Candidatus Uhrbacteria bacterium]